MSRFTLTAIASATLASAAFAQSTPGYRAQEQIDNPLVQASMARSHTGLQSFMARTAGRWTARFDELKGVPTMIYGSGLQISARPLRNIDDAQAAAFDTLQRFPELWGTDTKNLELVSKVKTGSLYIFTWQQKFDGLEVRGARVQIQVHEVGRVAALVAEGVSIPEDFVRVPKLAPEDAEAAIRAMKKLRSTDSVLAKDFLVYVKGESGHATPKLAYRIDVDQPSADTYEKVFVDANTGAVLEVTPGRYNDVKGTVTGTVNTSLSGSASPVPNVPLPGITVNVAGVGTAVTDSSGNYYIATALPGPFNVSATLAGPRFHVVPIQGAALSAATTTTNISGFQVGNLAFNSSPVEFGTAQANGAWMHEVMTSYWGSRVPSFGSGYTNQAVNVNLSSTCNAYYDPADNSINFYAAGGGCVNTAYSTVVYHEFGHGVDDFFGGIPNGALSEAIGDISAMYVTGQAIVGQDFFGSGSNIRTGENTTTWPASSCFGEVHCVGETYMGFAWQAWKKLTTSLGPVLGVQVAETDFLGALPANNTSIPNAVTQVFILDDDDADLTNGTPHYADLAAAAIMKGFTPPAVSFLSFVHTRHPDTFNQSQPYAIYATITALSPNTVASAFIDYSVDGGATQTVAMTPTAVANQFVGNIPPLVGPKVVSYWIRATDNLANTVVVPTGDDAYRFAVGRKTTLFYDDLESGAPGWTHVLVLKNDEWQLGKPQTAGSNNYDPTSAYSGNNCWGTDLQLTGSNGNYSSNADNYLESPNVDATGFTGVHIRFRRWLTVQKSSSDQATTLVNGAQVYINPTSTDLFDTTWTLQDYAAPAADNAAAFRARWRLKSNGSTQYGGWNVDDIEIYSLQATPVVNFNINPAATSVHVGTNLQLNFAGTPFADYEIYAGLDDGPSSLDGYGVIGAGMATLNFLTGGTLDGAGNDVFALPIPNDPFLVGIKIYWVGGAVTPGALPQISNTVVTTFIP
jgi:hypothetical protein